MADQTLFPSNAGENKIGAEMDNMMSGGQPQEVGVNPETQGATPQNPEMYQKVIDALMSKLKSKYGQLNSLKFAGGNQNSSKRNDILKVVFDSMRKAGIDPSDPQSINNFMGMIAQESPDLYELFVTAINGLLGPEGDQTPNSENMGPSLSPETAAQPPATEASAPGVTPPSQYPNLSGLT